ncbi:Tryptophan aminotransferase 1 [Hordeum vulgare]|nr:Tryptophan aminotransferase 1 [Hordeum vulgare]
MVRDHGDGVMAIVGRIGMVGSIALNLAALVIYLRGSFFWSISTATKKQVLVSRYGRADGELLLHAPVLSEEDHMKFVSYAYDIYDNVIFCIGDPTMFETFWRGPISENATLVIPGWQTMSYFSDIRNLCWFLEPILECDVRRLHRLVGNAAAEGYHVLVGTGSMQLFQAALYALAPPTADMPVSVVSLTPLYLSYPLVTDFLNSGLYRWAGDANTFDGDDYIEWALVKDKEVAQKMNKFMELNTIGVSKDAKLRAAKILGLIVDGYEHQLTTPASGDVNLLFHFARREMVYRWRALRAAVATSGIFSLPDKVVGFCTFTKDTVSAHPSFAWLCCEKEEVEDLESFLREHKIITRSGNKFGADRKVVRISMVDINEAFNIFINRLAAMK